MSLGFDPHALERAFLENGRPTHAPQTLPAQVKLIPTRRRPALLPTAIYLTDMNKTSFISTLAPGLAPPVNAVLVLPHTQRLRVTSVALVVDAGHPAQRNTTGTFYSLQCEPYTR
jgi:hypothetical protein